MMIAMPQDYKEPAAPSKPLARQDDEDFAILPRCDVRLGQRFKMSFKEKEHARLRRDTRQT